MAAPSQSPLGAPLSFAPAAEGAEQAKLQEVQELQRKLAEAYQARPMFDPALLAMARGFGAPTRTGSFFESLGNVAGELGPVQEAQQQRAQEIARMKFEMSRNELNEQQKKRILGSLFVESQDAAGNKVLSYNPQAAKDLTMLTGDPKYVADLADQMRKQNLQSAYSNAFVPTESGQYKINTGAIKNIFSLAGPEEAQKFFKSIPEMRKSGMLADLSGDKTTPFDSLVILADTLGPKVGPAFKQQAQYLASQYNKGILDEEKANNQAKDLLTAMNSTVGRQEALENTKANQAIQQALAASMHGLRAEQVRLQQEKVEDKKQAEIDTKVKAAKDVDSLLDEMRGHYDNLKSLGSITDTSGGMLSNLLASAKISDIGQAIGGKMGTETQKSVNEINTMRPLLLQAIKNATGMSSQQMNSNAELKFFLNAATDPKLGYQTNVDAINRLQSMFGLTSLPPRVRPPTAQPSGAAPAAAPKPTQAQGVPVWDPNTKTWK